MAKTKSPKKEKIVDLNPKPERIEDHELAELQSTIQNIDKLTIDVGRLEVQKATMLQAMNSFTENINKLRAEFTKKYGTDNINIQTGEIGEAIPDPNSATTDSNGEINKED
tara:strand:+ start:56 stop:388 length:333 start_codon:yes stop_codon:yes gene_type:complete